jgi:hypothetical protein
MPPGTCQVGQNRATWGKTRRMTRFVARSNCRSSHGLLRITASMLACSACARGVATPGGGVQAGDEHRHIQSAGRMADQGGGPVPGAEQRQRDREVLVVERLGGHMVPGLPLAVRPPALAQVDTVDGVAQSVEVLGDVGLEEEVGHPVDEQDGGALPPFRCVCRSVTDERAAHRARCAVGLPVRVGTEVDGVACVAVAQDIRLKVQFMDALSQWAGKYGGEILMAEGVHGMPVYRSPTTGGHASEPVQKTTVGCHGHRGGLYQYRSGTYHRTIVDAACGLWQCPERHRLRRTSSDEKD